MKLDKPLFHVLGIIAALGLPAVVVAQQFTANQPLRAADLQQLADRVVQVGETVPVTSLQSNTSTGAIAARTFTSRGDGMIMLVPSGNSFRELSLTVRTLVAGSDSVLGRTFDGNALTLPIRQGQQFTIVGSVGGQLRDAVVNVYWTPLRANAPAPL